MMRDTASLSKHLCILGVRGGGDARSAVRMGLNQGLFQWCYYYLEYGITATAVPILEVVADLPLQSSLQWGGTFFKHTFFSEV